MLFISVATEAHLLGCLRTNRVFFFFDILHVPEDSYPVNCPLGALELLY